MLAAVNPHPVFAAQLRELSARLFALDVRLARLEGQIAHATPAAQLSEAQREVRRLGGKARVRGACRAADGTLT
jgi:hypothetical protein